MVAAIESFDGTADEDDDGHNIMSSITGATARRKIKRNTQELRERRMRSHDHSSSFRIAVSGESLAFLVSSGPERSLPGLRRAETEVAISSRSIARGDKVTKGAGSKKQPILASVSEFIVSGCLNRCRTMALLLTPLQLRIKAAFFYWILQ